MVTYTEAQVNSRTQQLWEGFWRFYERSYFYNLLITTGLFLLQLVHLTWLFGEVVWTHATGHPLFVAEGVWKFLIIAVDYTEIPALISVSLLYIRDLRRNFSFGPLFYLFLLNSQWLHLFWITDEKVVEVFGASAPVVMPLWLAWVAILIDYAEIPVMFDAVSKLARELKNRTR